MSVFNPYGVAPGVNAYQAGPVLGGYNYPNSQYMGYASFPNYMGGSTALGTGTRSVGGAGSGLAAGASILGSVANYMDDAQAARSHVQQAEQNTDNAVRAAVEGRRSMQYQASLDLHQAQRDRHERFQALAQNFARRGQARAGLNPNSVRAAALNFRGNEPSNPGARPSAQAFNNAGSSVPANGGRVAPGVIPTRR